MLSLIVASGLGPGCANETAEPEPTASQSRAADDGSPARGNDGQMPPSLRRAFVAARMAEAGPEHALRWASAVAEATHPSMPLSARFDDSGVEIADGLEAPSWSGRLRIAGVGRNGAVRELPRVAPEGGTHRVTYRREATTEWYLHGPLGLEQGVQVTERPAGDGPLVVEVKLEGLRPEVAGDRVELSDHEGAVRAAMSDLFASDAEGELLPARFDVHRGRLRYVVDDANAAYPVEIDPLVATEQAILRASDAGAGDNFGRSVALDGDTALVGAWRDDHSGMSDAGTAYVYVRTGSTWSEQAILRSSDAAAGDWFGRSVAIHGDTALVGADGDDHSGAFFAGSAYVYVRTGSTWSEQAMLRASDAAGGRYFGGSVALYGNTALVGANGAAPSAYVYVRAGSSWSEQAILRASDAGAGFGDSVALYSDTALVGADGVGSAYVYERTGSTWSEQAILRASDASSTGDHFGSSVALYGNAALIGAYWSDHSGLINAGSAYVYERTGSSWSEQAILRASDAAAGDEFGRSVALDGNTALVGAWWDDHPGLSNAGSAYVFARTGSTWSEDARLRASDAASNDYFGMSVALRGASALVGAENDYHSGLPQAGSAYVFLLQFVGGLCTAASECSSGFCVDGVCCDTECGGGSTADCQACSVAAGTSTDGLCEPVSAGAVCRPAAGDCDVAETCTGSDVACPADGVADGTTICRAVASECDVAESCTGTNPDCPADVLAGSSVVCREAAGDCDLAETCTGSDLDCPADRFADEATVCRAAVGDCDLAETCIGSGADCPTEGFADVTTICRAAVGDCDEAETCPGTGADCPADALARSSVICREAAGECDVTETCTGGDADCPEDAIAEDGTTCDDGMACTEQTACAEGSCVGSTLDCDDGDPCTADGCEEAEGCSHEAIADCGPDAGTRDDAGISADAAVVGPTADGGCGCHVATPTTPRSAALLALAMVWLLGRRRSS